MDKTENLKDGKKTSELKVLIATVLGLATAGLAGGIQPDKAALIGGILSGLYIISRTLVKMTKTKKDDAIVKLIEEYIIPKIKITKKDNE